MDISAQHTCYMFISGINFDSALRVEKKPVSDLGVCQRPAASHLRLEPFFMDNLGLHLLYKCLGLEQDEPTSDDMIWYTGGRRDAKAVEFSEDTWSIRLVNGLKHYLPHKFRSGVEFTGDKGKTFRLYQSGYTGLPQDLADCYIFHGSPDITIKPSQIIQVDQEGSESQGSRSKSSSESEPETVIENALQHPEQVSSFPSKLGELLANLHISVSKKFVKMFYNDKLKERKLSARGLFIGKGGHFM